MAKCEGFDEAAAHWVLVQYDKLYEKGNNNLKKVNPLNLLKFLFFFLILSLMTGALDKNQKITIFMCKSVFSSFLFINLFISHPSDLSWDPCRGHAPSLGTTAVSDELRIVLEEWQLIGDTLQTVIDNGKYLVLQ